MSAVAILCRPHTPVSTVMVSLGPSGVGQSSDDSQIPWFWWLTPQPPGLPDATPTWGLISDPPNSPGTQQVGRVRWLRIHKTRGVL